MRCLEHVEHVELDSIIQEGFQPQGSIRPQPQASRSDPWSYDMCSNSDFFYLTLVFASLGEIPTFEGSRGLVK